MAIKGRKKSGAVKGEGRVKRQPNQWQKNLQQFNADKEHFTIPKKGSKDYETVKSLHLPKETPPTEKPTVNPN